MADSTVTIKFEADTEPLASTARKVAEAFTLLADDLRENGIPLGSATLEAEASQRDAAESLSAAQSQAEEMNAHAQETLGDLKRSISTAWTPYSLVQRLIENPDHMFSGSTLDDLEREIEILVARVALRRAERNQWIDMRTYASPPRCLPTRSTHASCSVTESGR